MLPCIGHRLWSAYNFELLLVIHGCVLFSGEVSSNVHAYALHANHIPSMHFILAFEVEHY